MTNLLRGEVSVEALDKRFVLSFGINTLCMLEDELGKTIAEIGDGLQGATPDLRLIRTIVCAALQEHHEGTTEKEAGRLITAMSLPVAAEKIALGFQAAFAPAGEGAGSRPRTPAARKRPGTGRSS